VTSSLYYEHSGNYTPQGVTTAGAIALCAAVVMAAAYAYLLQYIPFIIIRMFLPMAFGAGLGFVVAAMLRWQHTRNMSVSTVTAAAVALAAFYFSWCVWAFELFRQAGVQLGIGGIFTLGLHPDSMWNVVRGLAETGVWSVKGDHAKSATETAVSGWQLWLVWGTEAVAVPGFAILAARQIMGRDPYCESCSLWSKATSEIARISAVPLPELRQHLESKNFSYVAQHAAGAQDAAYYRLDLHSCPQCQNLHPLTVKWTTVNKKGKKNEKVVVDKLLLSCTEAQALRELTTRKASEVQHAVA